LQNFLQTKYALRKNFESENDMSFLDRGYIFARAGRTALRAMRQRHHRLSGSIFFGSSCLLATTGVQ
jgi:hypothetical protein